MQVELKEFFEIFVRKFILIFKLIHFVKKH